MRSAPLMIGFIVSAAAHAVLLLGGVDNSEPAVRIVMPSVEVGLVRVIAREVSSANTAPAAPPLLQKQLHPPEPAAPKQPSLLARPKETAKYATPPDAPATQLEPSCPVTVVVNAETPTRPSPATASMAMAPVCTFNPPPGYPASALRQGWEGEVWIHALIAADGLVQAASVEKTSGYPILDQAAIDAVETWRFQPAPASDSPMERPVSIPVQFKLRRS